MKLLFTLLVCCICSLNSFAECVHWYMTVWPSGKTVKTNTIFLLEEYWPHGDKELTSYIRRLNTEFPIYLLSSTNERVELEARDWRKSEYSLEQVILVPKKHLTAGLTYKMIIDSMPHPVMQPQKWTDGKQVAPTWLVENDPDTQQPEWTSEPVAGEKIYKEFGCGPLVTVAFNMPVKDSSAFLVKTTLSTLLTGKQTTYLLKPESDGSLLVGHGMCSGGFALEDGMDYKVTFELMDASGNYAKNSMGPILFRKIDKENPFVVKD